MSKTKNTPEFEAMMRDQEEAQRKFSDALDAYRKYKGGLTEEEKEVSDSVSMLTEMFKGFNPNAI